MPVRQPKRKIRAKKPRFFGLFDGDGRNPALSLLPIVYFPAGWAALLILVIVDAGGSASCDWMKLPSAWWWGFCSVPFVINLRLVFYGLGVMDFKNLRRYWPVLGRIYIAAEFLALASGTSSAMCLLTYLAAAIPYPLVDQGLNNIDRALGFDWPGLYGMLAHSFAYPILRLVYMSITAQVFLLALRFALKDDRDRLYEIYWILLTGILIAIVMACLWPSFGPPILYWTPEHIAAKLKVIGYSIPDVTAVRAHQAPDFSTHRPIGMINFPSFHTVCALVFCYAFRGCGWLTWAIGIVNAVMLVAIPFVGSHYLADVIGGVAVTLASILAVRMLSRLKAAQ